MEENTLELKGGEGEDSVEGAIQKLKEAYDDPTIVKLWISGEGFVTVVGTGRNGKIHQLDEGLRDAILDLIVATLPSRPWKEVHFWYSEWMEMGEWMMEQIQQRVDADVMGAGKIERMGSTVHGTMNFVNMPISDAGMNCFHYWSRDGKADKILKLLNKEDNDNNNNSNETVEHMVNAKSQNFGWTPLHLASCNGHLEVVKVLLEGRSITVNTINKFGNSPIRDALANGHVEVAKLLVAGGADLNPLLKDTSTVPPELPWGEGKSLLHHAAADENKIDVVKFLLEHGMDANSSSSTEEEGASRGETALFRTMAILKFNHEDFTFSSGYNIEASRILVEHGADVNFMNKDGDTPFSKACGYGYTELVRLFMGHGANVEHVSTNGFTPLMEACRRGADNFDIIQLLVEGGAKVNATATGINGDNFETPLLLAAKSSQENLKIIEFLVDHGADTNVRDSEGKSPLHSSPSIVSHAKFFVEQCSLDVNAKDNHGRTPLHYIPVLHCVANNAKPCLDKVFDFLLTKHNMDVNDKDNNSKTALHYAAEEAQLETIQCLVDKHKADVNAKDSANLDSILHAVTMNTVSPGKIVNLDVVKFLVDRGADVNSKNKSDKNPLQCTAMNSEALLKWNGIDNWHVIKCLIDSGTQDIPDEALEAIAAGPAKDSRDEDCSDS